MRIYILDTTRFYHEDFEEYPRVWFSCPVDSEKIRERLEVQNEGKTEIEDYELPFPLEDSTRLWEISALCRTAQEVQGTPFYYETDVIREWWFHSFTKFIDNKDHIRCYPVQDEESPTCYLAQEMQVFGEVHPDLMDHIDYTVTGRRPKTSENYPPMDDGIFSYCQREMRELRGNTGLHC